MNRLTRLLVAVSLLPAGARADAPGLVLEEIAREGQPAPGAPGATFKLLRFPMLGAKGAVALTCVVEAGAGDGASRPVTALFAGEPGRLVRVATEGEVAPALRDKPLLRELELVGIDAAGRVLFNGTVAGRASGVESDVVWYGRGEFVGRIARTGEQMLGTTNAPTDVRGESLAADGTIVLRARLPAGGDEPVFYVGPPDAPGPLPGPDAPPPPGSGAVPFGRPVDVPRVNAAGQVLVRTRRTIGGSAREAVWLGTQAGFRRVADTFTPVPALNGESFRGFSGPAADAGPPYALGDGGHVVFWASGGAIGGSPAGLWANRGGKFHDVARGDTRLPGCGPAETASIEPGSVSMTATGQAILFHGLIRGGDSTASATWLHDAGKLSLLSRSDRPIAGLSARPTQSADTRSRLSHDGRLVEPVELLGTGGTPTGTAVAVFERGKGWRMLAAPGDTVDVWGQPAALTRVEWASGIGADGRFLLTGELSGRPGRGLYRVTPPNAPAASRPAPASAP